MAKAAPPSNAITVGRTVHYGVTRIAAGAGDTDLVVPYMALVTEVDEEGLPTLYILHPSGQHDVQRHVLQTETLAAGCWMWPPRE